MQQSKQGGRGAVMTPMLQTGEQVSDLAPMTRSQFHCCF